jgi:hypothetical protein
LISVRHDQVSTLHFAPVGIEGTGYLAHSAAKAALRG